VITWRINLSTTEVYFQHALQRVQYVAVHPYSN